MFQPKELFGGSFEEISLPLTVEANHTGSWEIRVDFYNLAISWFELDDKRSIVKMKIANFSCSIEHNQEIIGEPNTNDSFFVVILREFTMQSEWEREEQKYESIFSQKNRRNKI